MWRTQVEVRRGGKVETFINNLLGNHATIVKGDVLSKLGFLINLR